jgi:hypothetical protein
LESRLEPVPGPEDRLKPTRNDARYPGNVSVWYPFHPFYASDGLIVVRHFGCRDVEYVEIAAAETRQAVPA